MDSRQLILLLAEYIGVIAVMMIAGTSRRFQQRRPLAFKYPFREGTISIGLFAFVLILSFIIYIKYFTPIQAADLVGQRLLMAGLSLIPFGLTLVRRGQPLRSAGWSRELLNPALRVGIALIFLTIFLSGKFMSLAGGLPRERWMDLLFWVGIALAEETIFRGYIQPRVSAWLGDNYGWIVTAVMFAFWQVPHLLADPNTLVVRLLLAAVQGLVLGWIMRKSGHVMAPVMYRAFSEWLRVL